MLVLALLLGGLAVAAFLGRLGVPGLATGAARMRLALAAAFVFVGVDHLRSPDRYLPMLPSVLPAPELVVLGTGLLELAAAVGLMVPRSRRIAALCAALYLLAVWPANWKVLLDGGAVAGLPSTRGYYAVRVMLQPLFVWWALAAGEWVRIGRWRAVAGGARHAARAAVLAIFALTVTSVGTYAHLHAAAAPARRVASAGSRHTLTVIIVGARRPIGQLRISLFDAPAGFPRDAAAAIRRHVAPLRATSDTVGFADLPSGRYAVAIHHDENGNGALDANAFGMPREGWGATNDPRPRLRAPRFAEAAVQLDGDRQVVVRLTY